MAATPGCNSNRSSFALSCPYFLISELQKPQDLESVLSTPTIRRLQPHFSLYNMLLQESTMAISQLWNMAAQVVARADSAFRQAHTLQPAVDAQWRASDSQPNGSWKDIGDDANEKAFNLGGGPAAPAVKSRNMSDPPEPKVERYAEWEFYYLPTETIHKALTSLDLPIRTSIFKYCRENFLDQCDMRWDAACDVGLDIDSLREIFGRSGFATQDMQRLRAQRFPNALDDLYRYRCVVAHPTNPSKGGTTLQFVCQHISFVRTMARLLEDQPLVQKIDVLLESLFEEGRQVRQFVEVHKTFDGLPDGAVNWPRHCERMFNLVIDVQTGDVERPSVAEEWQKHYRWQRVPPAIRKAALDWNTRYDTLGVRNPNYAG